jgi:photosystem II stability/assembly factor-like uncharacterized protein
VKTVINTALSDLLCVDNKIFAVGDKGTIILSLDKGLTWERINTKSFVKLNNIIKNNTGNIYVSGVNGTIFKL